LGIVVGVDEHGCCCDVAYRNGVVVSDSVAFVEDIGDVLDLSIAGRAIVNAAIAAEALRRIG
jgi:hypothetical protein